MFNRNHIKRKTDTLATTLEVTRIESQLDIHQVEITGNGVGDLNGGSIAWFTKSASKYAEYQPVQKDGADYVMAVTAGGVRTFEIPRGSVIAIKGVPAGLTATNGEPNWAVTLISGGNG